MFGKYGFKIIGGVGGAAASLLIVKCSSKLDNKENVPGCISPPDFAPTTAWDSNWDRLDPRFMKHNHILYETESDKKKAKDVKLEYPTARRNIYLIRHGQYNNREENDETATLTKLGEEQAALLGKRMAICGKKIASVTTSGMTRAMQTAEIMLKEMKEKYPDIKVDVRDPLLNEGPPCIPEPPYRQPMYWDPDYRDFFADGARIEAAFRKYFHRALKEQKEDSFEIIVCHANVIRYFTLRALQLPPEAWLRIGLDHSSITKISLLPNGDVVLRGLGESGHLPPEKTTS